MAGDDHDDGVVACDDYRPDHNGECLNCDEPADAHPAPTEEALAAAIDWLDAELTRIKTPRPKE